MNRFSRMPFFVQLLLICGMAMVVPAIYGVVVREFATARSFFYSGVLIIVISLFVAVATFTPEVRQSRSQHWEGRNQLVALLAAYFTLPMLLAWPIYDSTDVTFLDAFFEMVSSLTTTGATLFPTPGAVSDVIHLWRALVGGFVLWRYSRRCRWVDLRCLQQNAPPPVVDARFLQAFSI